MRDEIKYNKVLKGFREKCKAALRSPFTFLQLLLVRKKEKDERIDEREPMEIKCYCWGYFFIWC